MLSQKDVNNYLIRLKESKLLEIPMLVMSWSLTDENIYDLTLLIKGLVKELQTKLQIPLVIAVGGNYGVGKTTFAHEFGKRYEIPPRSGLGTVVKTLKYLKFDDPVVEMIDKDRDTDNFNEKFDKQAAFLCGIINFIAQKAQESGSDYIIDGVQINPKYLDGDAITLSITLAVPNETAHKARLTSPITHFRRHPRDFNLKYLELVEKYLVEAAKEANTPVIVNHNVNKSVLIAGMMLYSKLLNLDNKNE